MVGVLSKNRGRDIKAAVASDLGVKECAKILLRVARSVSSLSAAQGLTGILCTEA